MEVRPAALGHVAHLDEVVAGLLEGVGQAGVALQAGRIVAVGHLAAGAGIDQRKLRVEGAAEAAAEHLEAERWPALTLTLK